MLFSPLRIFAAFAVATAAGVSAQAGLDDCMQKCLTQSLGPNTCTSLFVFLFQMIQPPPRPTLSELALFSSTDVACACSNKAFQSAVAACLNANCTSADQAAALELQQAECGSSTCSYTHLF